MLVPSSEVEQLWRVCTSVGHLVCDMLNWLEVLWSVFFVSTCSWPGAGEAAFVLLAFQWRRFLPFVVAQLLSRVWLFATPWTAARQASLSFTISQSLLKLMSIESMMPSNYLILCHPLLLLPSIFPSIRVFSNWVGSPHQVAKVLELHL